jgi:predicted O-methyltransferase YrrM
VRIRIHRETSSRAAATFQSGAFDWVYIDGDHSYEEVLGDLRSWIVKVKRGGILAGDDWHWRDEEENLSVQLAARQFATETGLSVEVLPNGQFLYNI